MKQDNRPFQKGQLINLLKEMNKLKGKNSFVLKWNHSTSTWEKYDFLNHHNTNIDSIKTIKSLTINVLYDRQGYNQHSQYIINSRLRYNYILNKTGNILPDIITFNQVTHLFYQMLKQCKWAQQHYWLSQFTIQMGNVILTKIQPIFVEKFKVSTCPRTIQGIFLPILTSQGKFKIAAFFSVHLTAYQRNVQRRTNQFNDLIKYIQRYKQFVDEIVLQGDMNFHSQDQKSIFLKHHYEDSWLQNYDLQQKPGYTFNSAQNSLINQIYWGFQKRKMRLDRILLKGTSIKCQSIKVDFDEPIYIEKSKDQVNRYNFVKGALLFLNDKLGIKLLRSKNKEDYLFASDHFGLIANLRILQN